MPTLPPLTLWKLDSSYLDADLPPAPEGPPPPPPPSDIVRPATAHFKRCYVAPVSLQRLAEPRMLNDEAMYAGMAVLAHQYPDNLGDMAFFDTYEYSWWCSDNCPLHIMKSTRFTEFWSREVIILPIHDADMMHWLLAVVYPRQGQIEFFDSLALSGAWREHGQVSPAPRPLLMHMD